jgi:hypothetical protein
MAEDGRKVLSEYVNDMLAVERDVHAMLRRHKADGHVKQFPNASRLMDRAEETVDRHLAAIQECAGQLGGESTVKKAVGAALGAIGAAFEKIRDDRASRILRDDYTALSFAAVCYEMLHTTALAIGDRTVADLALRHLKNYAPLVIELCEVVPEVVVQELSKEGKVPGRPEVAERARRNACEAWEQAASHAHAA